MNRTALLIEVLDWSQSEMAAWLGVGQATVSRLVRGQPETGAMPRALDFLEQQISDGLHGEEAQRRLAGAHISTEINPESDREIV